MAIQKIKNINANVINLLKDELFVGKDFALLWNKFKILEKENVSNDTIEEIIPENKFFIDLLNEYGGVVNLKG